MLELLLALLLPASVRAQETPRQVAGEIESLFAALESSGCEFQRNGRWYAAGRASQHLRRKYDYLRDKGLAPTTAAFIEHAASRSSVSGNAYRVRCPGKPEIDSAAWFRQHLATRKPPA